MLKSSPAVFPYQGKARDPQTGKLLFCISYSREIRGSRFFWSLHFHFCWTGMCGIYDTSVRKFYPPVLHNGIVNNCPTLHIISAGQEALRAQCLQCVCPA